MRRSARKATQEWGASVGRRRWTRRPSRMTLWTGPGDRSPSAVCRHLPPGSPSGPARPGAARARAVFSARRDPFGKIPTR